MTFVVSFIASPNSQRKTLYETTLQELGKSMSVMGYSCDLQDNIKFNKFETYYKTSLRYMIKDVENRVMAREKNVDLLLYRFSPLDILAFTNRDEKIAPEYKTIIQNNLLTHMQKFPINLLLYCEFISYDKNRSDFMEKESHKLAIDSAIMKLLENRDFEPVPSGTIEDRVKFAIKTISSKMTKI